MEDITSEIPSEPVDQNENKATDSSENFKKFMYEVIDKNGVINDLRAYLRGHIVNLLKSVRTGETPSCQKHLTQRLELSSQAVNILIAEYLLRMEFSYSLSVFISEIPLANMVFGFSKKLLENIQEPSVLRFESNDICLILHYLGIQCDSEQITNIAQMYQKDKNEPLLICILKSLKLFPQNFIENGIPSQESINKSSDSDTNVVKTQNIKSPEKCRHIVYCNTCLKKHLNMKENYKKKKIHLHKQKGSCTSNMDFYMKNINSMEKVLIDELFEQMKEVYENEIQMTKQDEERILRKTLEHQADVLQKKCQELESTYKAREEALQASVQHKKRFLLMMARTLRKQLTHITTAMGHVRQHKDTLTTKELKLKSQLAEAEKVIRDRGEAMRTQISNEILLLENHLQKMKQERDTINRERDELETLKQTAESSKYFSQYATENDDLKSQYDSITNDLSLLKKYVENTKLGAKCFVEKGTITDVKDNVLNNRHGVERNEENTKTPNRVVNEFRKHKNVNFDQCGSRSRSRSRSSASSGDAPRSHTHSHTHTECEREMNRLHDENNRLRDFARQQRAHIDSLEYQQARLQAQLSARAQPTNNLQYTFNNRSNTTPCNNRDGGGEQLSLIGGGRVTLPGEYIPFIGTNDRHADSRRYMMSQWRMLRRRVSPLGGVVKHKTVPAFRPSTAPANVFKFFADNNNPSVSNTENETANTQIQPSCSKKDEHKTNSPQEQKMGTETPKKDSKSRFAKPSMKIKENISKKDNIKIKSPIKREKSPNSILREAKIRLRKLEIEAEAVEKSYLNFKLKREAYKVNELNNAVMLNDGQIDKADSKSYINQQSTKSTSQNKPQTFSTDIDKYIKEHNTKLEVISTYFNNKNSTSLKIKPIPLSQDNKDIKKKDFLETPLSEFRKYYYSEKREYDRTPTSASLKENLNKKWDKSKDDSKSNKNNSDDRTPTLVSLKEDYSQKLDKSKDESKLDKNTNDRTPTLANLKEGVCQKSDKSNDESKLDKNNDRTPTLDSLKEDLSQNSNKNKDDLKLDRNTNDRTPTLASLKEDFSQKSDKSKDESKSDKNTNNRTPTLAKVKEDLSRKSDKSNDESKSDKNNSKTLSKEAIIHNNKVTEKSDISDKKHSIEDVSEIKKPEEKTEHFTEQIPKDTTAEVMHNLLEIDVENDINDIKINETSRQDILLVVESSIDQVISEPDVKEISPKMTILVSPKRIKSIEYSPDKSTERLTKDDKLESIYNKDEKVHSEPSGEGLENVSEQEQDYADDFSVENDSPSEYNLTPASIAKTSEDENFWD